MKRSWIIVVVIAVLLGITLAVAQARKVMMARYLANMPEPEMTVSVVQATEALWDKVAPAIGTFEAENGVVIASSVTGLVKDIAFVSGQEVVEGQKLLELDSDVEKANLRQAEARVELNTLTLERTRSLRQSDATSQAKLDQAVADLRAAQAEAEAYRATIGKRTVTAPFSGVLGISRVDLGQYIQPGQPIVSIQDLSGMRLFATLPQSAFSLLVLGQTVRATVTAYPDSVFEGYLAAVEPAIDTSGLVHIEARFENKDGLLRPGMFAKVSVVAAEQDHVIVVPQIAVNFALSGDYVFVVETDDKGERRVYHRDVKTGRRTGNHVAILEGVKAGDLVVVRGGMKLDNGAKVKTVEDGTFDAVPQIGHE